MARPAMFRYFKMSPEIIHLAVMMYVRYPLSLWNVARFGMFAMGAPRGQNQSPVRLTSAGLLAVQMPLPHRGAVEC